MGVGDCFTVAREFEFESVIFCNAVAHAGTVGGKKKRAISFTDSLSSGAREKKNVSPALSRERRERQHCGLRGPKRGTYFFLSLPLAAAPLSAFVAARLSCKVFTCSRSLAISLSETFRYNVELLGSYW